jgi:hypothetical protein
MISAGRTVRGQIRSPGPGSDEFAWKSRLSALGESCSLKEWDASPLTRTRKAYGRSWADPGWQPDAGNPVEIGGGCATVTGYKLPGPLIEFE